jgi:hypothetical protein
MKKLVALPLIAAMALAFTSCGGDEKEEEEEEEKKEDIQIKVCTFSYDNATTKFYWEAYKHTAQNPVNGQIEGVEVTINSETGNTVAELINGASFSLMTNTVNSKDAVRDKKISEIFFGAMANTDAITGTVAVNLDKASALSGDGTITLKMNDVEKELPMAYKVEGEEVTISANVDFNDWDGADALATLNAACEEKHTGDDGVNKMWPNVKITVKTTLTKNCE